MTSPHELTVPGFFENLAQIGAFITQVATAAGLDERAVYAVQMAVDEACTNIIEHAYGSEGQGPIHLVCQNQPDGLQIDIYDQGQPFDPTQIPPLDPLTPLYQRQPGGMGFFFIHRLVDRVEFQFGTPAGNRLTLFKHREPSG
jgi:anti-sigma regulatory factor (Ser/Thr protein kinase)